MSLPWFRLYTEFASDPKIQLLAFEDQRHYIVILCLQGNGVLDSEVANEAYRERIIAKALGLDPSAAGEAKRRLVEAGLIASTWHPVKWDSRQFGSDSSTDRVRKFREKQRGNVSETLQERPGNGTDKNRTDTDSDQKTTARQSSAPTDQPEFLDFRLVYPGRAGDQGWRKAVRAINARLAEGYTWPQIIDGAKRYAEYVRSTGSEGTQFVKQACVFVGPDLHFLADWKPAPTKADTRLKSNLSAAEEFMRRTEPTSETV